ncbi:phenylalanine--tRNA ligase subunit beta [Patescibacteria group bacterium]|nr:phenylalanine--tRNA ligase subunit beta [Patescibacteria group bacterium]
MYISLDWLREYVDLPKKLNLGEFANLITIRSAEVEGIEDQQKAFEKMVVGRITKLKKHPDADLLRLTIVDIGDKKEVQIVCGGSNLKEDILVPVALPGAIVKWHGQEIVEMKIARVRGQESHGMICTAEEIGLPAAEDEREILDLSHLKTKPGTSLAKALNANDTIIEFDNKALTHRPDLWGHRGIAREIAAITGSKFTDKHPNPKIPQNGESPAITVKDSELCPRYMGVIIKGVRIGDSPEWLAKRLRATGHSVINNIVDVTNYVMEEIGQPLHAFDLKQISGGIVVRTAKKNEKIVTLDGETKILDENMLLIADKKKPLAVAGVMGGENSGIDEKTVDILIESANFDPVSVRQTSVRLGLRTDSVQRFEKSLDPLQCEIAIKLATKLILELCPEARVAGPIADIANFDTSEPLVPVDVKRVQTKIGVEVPPAEMGNYLEQLGFEVQGKLKENAQTFVVKVPSWRATKDVDIEDDIVEEIARMYGYEKIPAIVPALPAFVPKPNFERRHKHDTRAILAYALGLTEVYNYSFYSKQTVKDYGLNPNEHLHLKNYLSEEQSLLRTSLIPNLVRSLREAAKYEDMPHLFELGRVYIRKGRFMPEENKMLAAALLLPKTEKNPFTFIKGILEKYFEVFNIEGAQIQKNESPAPYMHPFQTASVVLRGKNIGSLFTLHPALTEEEDFDGRVACFEVNFSSMSKARQVGKKYEVQSVYPSIEFDVSVLLDKKVTVGELEKALKRALPDYLKKIKLFDSYEGDKIEKGKKSLAFRLTLQADDRTLENSDLVEAQRAAWETLEKLGGAVRGRHEQK